MSRLGLIISVALGFVVACKRTEPKPSPEDVYAEQYRLLESEKYDQLWMLYSDEMREYYGKEMLASVERLYETAPAKAREVLSKWGVTMDEFRGMSAKERFVLDKKHIRRTGIDQLHPDGTKRRRAQDLSGRDLGYEYVDVYERRGDRTCAQALIEENGQWRIAGLQDCVSNDIYWKKDEAGGDDGAE